jgi:hypothetical protein
MTAAFALLSQVSEVSRVTARRDGMFRRVSPKTISFVERDRFPQDARGFERHAFETARTRLFDGTVEQTFPPSLSSRLSR